MPLNTSTEWKNGSSREQIKKAMVKVTSVNKPIYCYAGIMGYGKAMLDNQKLKEPTYKRWWFIYGTGVGKFKEHTHLQDMATSILCAQ